MKSTIAHTDLSKRIYKKLKEMILAKQFEPGQKIIQEKIAAQLGVSRTPLNKALQMLEYELLVESIPRRGMYVKNIDLNEMLEIFEIREGLESLAARLVTQKQDKKCIQKLRKQFSPYIENPADIDPDKYREADDNFHAELIKSANNSVLSKLYIFINLQSKIKQMGLVRAPQETLIDHIKIIEAIENNLPDKAAYEAALHIRKSSELIKNAIGKNNK